MLTRKLRFLALVLQQYSPSEVWDIAKAVLRRNTGGNLLGNLPYLKSFGDRYILKRFGASTLLKRGELKFLLRRTTSDFRVFEQIFECQELAPVVELIRERRLAVNRILDCGANIGLSSIYLSAHLKKVEVLALEPEPENFRQMKENIRLNGLKNITPIQKGIWTRSASLIQDTEFCAARDWAFSLREPAGEEGVIEVDTAANILKSENWSIVDYLKMDIEGAEFNLFRNPESISGLLEHAKIVSVEVHERKGDRREIEQVLSKFGFKLRRSGELLIAFK